MLNGRILKLHGKFLSMRGGIIRADFGHCDSVNFLIFPLLSPTCTFLSQSYSSSALVCPVLSCPGTVAGVLECWSEGETVVVMGYFIQWKHSNRPNSNNKYMFKSSLFRLRLLPPQLPPEQEIPKYWQTKYPSFKRYLLRLDEYYVNKKNWRPLPPTALLLRLRNNELADYLHLKPSFSKNSSNFSGPYFTLKVFPWSRNNPPWSNLFLWEWGC